MKKHSECIKYLEEAQTTEHDNREKMREADHFLNKRDGMWDPEVIAKFSEKPRFSFDECNPIVDDIMGEIGKLGFDIKVLPTDLGGEKETAEAYEGIIRRVETISKARLIYDAACRVMVGTGMSAWRVIADYRDGDSFQQDLMIKRVPNVQDSLWFDPNAQEQDMSDADHCWILSSMTYKAYKKKYPQGTGVSVGSDIRTQVYPYKKPHEVIIGEYLYKKEEMRELALMSDGRVFVIDENFDKVKDELSQAGITIVKTRKRPYEVVYQKIFDGSDWLSDSKETVFCYLPVIPIYANFKISEGKVTYWGIVEKLMDAQRVLNYAESRKIEEGALAPRGKTWMTKSQANDPEVRKSLRTMNTNTEPVQFYDHVEGHPPPAYQGAPQSNPGLVEVSASTQNFIQRTSGVFDEARGTAPPQRSGYAIDLLQSKSDNPKKKFILAMETAMAHTCRVLIKAIPKVYDIEQELLVVNQDRTTDKVRVNFPVFDQQTQQIVILNDLKQGNYDVTCTMGPAFSTKQQETVTVLSEIAAIDPSILQIGSDILLSNISSPGIDQIAERKRMQMVQSGVIPPNQLTEEEKQMLQAQAQQPKQPDAMTIAAQAEMVKAQARQQEVQLKTEIAQQKIQLDQIKELVKKQQNDIKVGQENQKNSIAALQAVTDQIKVQAETLKILKDVIGADAVVTPGLIDTFQEQVREVNQSIKEQ